MLSSQKKEKDDNNNNNNCHYESSTPSQFVYLGTMLMIYHKDNHSHFEIYGKSYPNESVENIEIILNDVTTIERLDINQHYYLNLHMNLKIT